MVGIDDDGLVGEAAEALSGVGFSLLATFTGSTSNTNPWSFVIPPSPVRSSVSSHVSHVPHGVTPPAQLVDVPARLTYSATTLSSSSSSVVVVPPIAAGS